MTDHVQPEATPLLNGKPYNGDPEFAAKPRVWKRRVLIGVLLVETCFALPKLAHGQFLNVFDAIFSSIQNDIGSSLGAINQVAQQMQKLYQTTVAPLAAINQARGFVANSINTYRGQMNQVFNTPFSSAVTANDDILYLLAMELRAMRKRIGFVLSDAFRRSLLETRTLTNSNNSEVVPLRDFLSGNQR